MSNLHKKPDLTRWNRSGLKRFRYINGNAVSYLEALRQAMAEQFNSGGEQQWPELDNQFPVMPGESVRERQQRWQQQYAQPRQDYGWEILRAYARSAHVLTEHLDAYANESYLGTATQWQHVRHLVDMLDYHPAPPASASTPIAILAKEDQSGTLAAGFAFKNKPVDGAPEVIFETLEDLDVDASLNCLKAKHWNRSAEVFDYVGNGNQGRFPLAEMPESVSVGASGVLIAAQGNVQFAVAIKVTGIFTDGIQIQGEAVPVDWPSVTTLSQLTLLLQPDFIQQPQLTGDNVVSMPPGHGLTEDAVVAWQDGSWRAARVEQVSVNRVKLSAAAPVTGTSLYLLSRSDKVELSVGNRVILPLSNMRASGALFDLSLNSIGTVEEENNGNEATPIYDYLLGDNYHSAYYLPLTGAGQLPAAVGSILASHPQGLEFDGEPGELSTGDWLVAESAGQDPQAVRIEQVDQQEDSFEIEVTPTLASADRLYGKFALSLRPQGYDQNLQPLFVTDLAQRSDTYSLLVMENDTFPAILDIGRTLLVVGRYSTVEVLVKDVENGMLKVEPALPGSGLSDSGSSDDFTRYHSRVYANVVDSGHGETQQQSVLGSGEALQSSQQFAFDVEDVSFVPDSQFRSGVSAAVTIEVEGRKWQQVDNLTDSAPEDPHYRVLMQEDGTLLFVFGDGSHGRRLPSGDNNVRIDYRVGSGLSGNLAANSLTEPVAPHHLVDGIVQPISSTGGNQMQSAESMRESAPASVLTLQRAVSLSDFTYLATSNSGVWQALAFRLQPGVSRVERIKVAVVPAGGGALGSLAETLTNFLSQHAVPGVDVSVVPYQPVLLDLKIVLRIKTDEYDPDLVSEDVRNALTEAFSLSNMSLGKPLYRSQVFAVVEQVKGVSNSHIDLNPWGFRDEVSATAEVRQIASGNDGAIKRISVTPEQVIYLHPELSVVQISTETFSLQEVL